MGQAQINVRTRACSRTSIARTKQAALTHNVRGKELNNKMLTVCTESFPGVVSVEHQGCSVPGCEDQRFHATITMISVVFVISLRTFWRCVMHVGGMLVSCISVSLKT